MPIWESEGFPSHPKWPFSFDLAGVERDPEVRERLLWETELDRRGITNEFERSQLLETAKRTGELPGMPENKWLDPNKPIPNPQSGKPIEVYPRMMYHEFGAPVIVKNEDEEKKKLALGFRLKPFPPKPVAEPGAAQDIAGDIHEDAPETQPEAAKKSKK